MMHGCEEATDTPMHACRDYMGRDIMNNAIIGLNQDGLVTSKDTTPASSRPITRGNNLVGFQSEPETPPQLPIGGTVSERTAEELDLDDAKTRANAFSEISVGHPDLSLFGGGREPAEVTRWA